METRTRTDWHNTLGLVALLPLIIMAITGVTFTWGKYAWPLLDKIQDTPSQAPRPTVIAPAGVEKLPIDPLVEKVKSLMADVQWTGFQPSNRETSAHAFFFSDGKNNNIQLYLNPYTGEELERRDGTQTAKGIVPWYRRNFGRLHTFGTYGFVPQLIWGLLSLTGTVLAITGLWISVKRWRRPKRRVP